MLCTLYQHFRKGGKSKLQGSVKKKKKLAFSAREFLMERGEIVHQKEDCGV